jgi:hypothetical protein
MLTIYNDYEIWLAGRRVGVKAGAKQGLQRGKKLKIMQFKNHELIEEIIRRRITEAMVRTKQKEVKEK